MKRSNPQFSKYGIIKDNPILRTWSRIKARCYGNKTKSYKHYEGKGIKMCEEWLNNKDAFYEWAMANGWKKGLTIDRINSNGNYEPSNCRWLTKAENNAKTVHKRSGRLHGNSLINEYHVIAMRYLAKANFTHQEISDFIGVNRVTVTNAISGETWKHVKEGL